MASGKLYTNAMKGFVMGNYSWKASGGSSFKIALVTSSYTPNQDTDIFWSSVSANEVANGGGYTTGGVALTLSDPAVDAATNETRMSAQASVNWATSTITARYAIIYQSTGTAGTSALIGYIDFGQDEISSSGDFTITFDANGLFKCTAA